jgi:flagellar motility protein MotE (MotC chaperone)
MMTKLKNPFVISAFSLVLNVALGVSLCWRAIVPLLEKMAVPVVAKLPVELKDKGWDFWTIEIENLSNELKGEKARLRKQADSLDQRAAQFAIQEKELTKLRGELDLMRKQIEEKMIEIGADEAKNLRTLAQTYANLTPRAAVAIIRELDDNTAVKILSLMKSDIVAPIFEEMSRTAGADGSPLARRTAVLSERLRLMRAAKPKPVS